MSKKLYTSGEINAVFNSDINKNLFFNKVEIDSRQLSNRIIFFAIKLHKKKIIIAGEID